MNFIFDLLKNYKKNFKLYTIRILAIASILLMFFYLDLPTFINSFELKLYDYRTRIFLEFSKNTADKDIVLLVYRDDTQKVCDSYPEIGLGRWPWPRNVWADLLKYLRRAPNNTTLFDIKFPSIDSLENDSKFANEIKKSQNTVMAYTVSNVSDKLGFVYGKIMEKLGLNPNETIHIGKNDKYFFFFLQNYLNIKKEYILKYLNKFIYIPEENFKDLAPEFVEGLSFCEMQGIYSSFLKVTKEIGYINVPNTSDITEVVRENTPLHKYYKTNLFAQSMALATARLNIPDKDISFSRDIWGYKLNFDNRQFPLNEYGNIYITWRPNFYASTKSSQGAYNTYSLIEAVIYERFETLDLQTGFYIPPIEDNNISQSHFIYLVKKSILNVYSELLQYSYNYELPITNFNNEDIAEINRLSDSYLSHLFNIIRNDNESKFLNFILINENKFDIYNYRKYLTGDNRSLSYIDPFYYGANPKINGVPIRDLIDLPEYTYEIPEFIIWKYIDNFYKLARPPLYFLNKIVIMGECSAGGDIHSTPLNYAYPGPEIVATTIDNYLNDGTPGKKLLTKAPWWLDITVIVFFILLTISFILKSKNYISASLILFSVIFIFIFINFFLFIYPQIRLWLNMIYPLFFIISTAIITVLYKNMIIDKDKHQITELFGKFVSPQVLDAILLNPKIISTKHAQKKELTVMFCDIRNFTTMSEQIAPDELIKQINEYFTEIVEVIIMKYNGTLDKYMGDAIMAFWGDPIPMEDHAQRAVLTALTILEHLKQLNSTWEKENKLPLKIGIGINTGDMIVGHMGSPRLVDYTVVGDNVNIAARLESLNKEYGTQIIISESTYNYVKDIVEVENLGEAPVRGKKTKLNIYSVKKLKNNAKVDFDKNPTLYTKTFNNTLE